MLAASLARIETELPDDALVLDVGGWAKPLSRADWVLDLAPYDTRGQWGHDGDPAGERFDAASWVQADICAREPWPFRDGQFDFAVCSHTLEDVRDPVWVCQELERVALAGYVEVPSRVAEQSRGIQGDFAGWSHHRWLVDIDDGAGEITFLAKHGAVHGEHRYQLPPEAYWQASEEERVQSLWWTGRLPAHERVLLDAAELDAELAGFVEAHWPRGVAPVGARRRLSLRRRSR